MLSEFFSLIDAQATTWMISLTITLLGWLGSGPLRALVTLAVLLYGFAIIRGLLQTPMLEGISKFLVLTMVLGLAAYPGLLIGNVYPFFFEAPFHLASLLPGAPGSATSNDPTTVYTALDNILSNGFQTATDIAADGSGWFTPYAFAATIILLTILFVAYAAFLLVLSKIALALLLGFTPLFLVLMLFSATRGLFERWLGMLFNYSLIPLLTLAVCGFSISWVKRQLDKLMLAGADPTASDVAAFALAGAIAFLLLLQITTIAASIGGGFGLSTVGFLSATYAKARGAVSAAGASLAARRRERASNDRAKDQKNWQASVSNSLGRIAPTRKAPTK
jgi:type IV secretion system protein VirB6